MSKLSLTLTFFVLVGSPALALLLAIARHEARQKVVQDDFDANKCVNLA